MNKPASQDELFHAAPVLAPVLDHAPAESGDDDFDWDADNSVIVKPVPGLAVYTNRFGQIVIRQQGGDLVGGEDRFVYFSAAHAEVLIARLTTLRRQADGGRS